MKSVAIYILGTLLLFPCMLVASDSLLGIFIAICWGVVLYHSPKFCPAFRKFWLSFWKVNLKIMYAFL